MYCIVLYDTYRVSYDSDNYEHDTNEFDIQKVKKWRDALTKAAYLSGHVLKDEENGNEARFIAKIVREVQLEVNLRFLNVPESLARVGSNFNCINTLLSIGSNDVRTIGIYGIGGIGKTTVSKYVYNKHLNHFEVGVFVENIKDISKLPNGLLRLQENLLSQLQKKEIKLSNSDEGINWIKKNCCSKRVLILLDDLDDFDQIKKLVGHKKGFSAGSRVIIVTRDEKVLKEAQVDHTYEMKVLNDDESLELFRWNAFGEGNPFPSEDYKSLSIETTKYCRGLPLALEVIGRHMYGLAPLRWKSALEEFHKYPEKTIQDRLKISYDALSEHGKKIFLDVACIFIGWDKDYLVKFWNGCEFSPENSITELLNKCLLKVDEKNCLRMHDLLRDMGRAIVLEASDRSLEKHSRVWNLEEVCDLQEHPKGAEAVEGISLDLSNLQSIALETKAFEAMHQLRFLLINKVDVTGSFEHLFGKLRWLSWQYCPLKSLPTDFHPRKLLVFDLKFSKIEKLWEGVKHLNNLKILDLSDCNSLVETPNFTGVRSLERLMLRNCKSLSTIDPSICELRSLEELDLEGCSCLDQLPEKLENMKSLKTLNVSDTLLEGLPDSIGQLSRLVHLRLKWCRKLKTLPTTICNLECLLDLDLGYCKNLINLPASTCNMTSLEKLNVGSCSNLKRLPEGMGNLKRLRTLNASNTGLEELPDSIGHLSSLVHLHLSECEKLRTLPDSICDLSSLEVLDINFCSGLQQFPTAFAIWNMHASFTGCQQLPDSVKNLKKLERLNLVGNNFCILPSTLCQLSNLTELNLSDCKSLVSLPELPPNLTELLLSYCKSLVSLPKLPLNLTYLCLNDCKSLVSLPKLPLNLTHLILSYCNSLVSLPELPPNLDAVDARGCTTMEKIPNLSNLKRLWSLDLSDSNRLVGVQGLENLKLRFLSMTRCNDLAMNTTFNESSLRFLSLRNCGLCDKDIPNDIVISLHSLQSLDLSGNDFCNLPSTLYQLSNLTQLFLSNCKSLVSLPKLPPNLGTLNASRCTALEKIPTLSNLKRLRGLFLSDSNRLVEVQGLENLKLRVLDMAGCNDLAMNTTFNESFFQRYFERDDDESNILLPKWNFQNWIIYQSMESTISFELPRSQTDNFQGIILWVVYAHCSSKHYGADITNNTSGKKWYHSRGFAKKCLGGYSWVSCIKSNFNSGDSIKISISEDINVKVEKCGAHWFIGSEGDEDENVHYYDDYDYNAWYNRPVLDKLSASGHSNYL